MTIGVLKYPGGHGDEELVQILGGQFGKTVREIWHKERPYSYLDVLFIGGGFPCRKSNSVENCMDDSPALNYLSEFASLGKLIVGIGNGFHLLCEAGLLPGMLVSNANASYINKQVFIKPENHANLMTRGLKKEDVLRIPIATEFGKYLAEESELINMRKDGQILFRYCDYEGRISESINYTGSIDNIAGICNSNKNIFGLIPQPERAITDFWNDADGKLLLKAFLKEIQYQNSVES
jgi:phosphoribosylformylglycinamidine synthase